METHIVPIVPQWKHIVNAQSACRVTTLIDKGILTLVFLPNGGSATFCTNVSCVHVETEGLFEIVPFDNAQLAADQTYNPASTNAQSGTAVAEAFSAGSTVVPQPAGVEPYTLKQGAALRLDPLSDTLELVPSALTTAQEMRVLYSPAEARTTPLIAVPQGVTLHWAGESEPTWEAGKDYVIQLLQTAPTRIEARLFNVPQGAKLPEWMTDAAHGYVAWSYDDAGKRVPVAANVDGQLKGSHQFDVTYATGNDKDIGSELSVVLSAATFDSQIDGTNQFSAVNGDIYLPAATFDSQIDGSYQFSTVNGDIYLPAATFEKNQKVVSTFASLGNVYAPRATFAELLSGISLINYRLFNTAKTLPAGRKLYFNAFNPRYLTGMQEPFQSGPSQESKNEYHFYSWELPNMNALNYWSFHVNNAEFYLPSLTLSLCAASTTYTIFGGAGSAVYIPHVNLRLLKNVPNFWRGTNGIDLENLRCVVYGPKLVDDGKGGLKPSDTTYYDTAGIKQMIAPADVQGEHLYTNGNKPTGWGIQDFRMTDAATGEFILDGAGDYTYKSTGHTIGLDIPSAAQGDADYEVCFAELEARGWDVLITYI